MASGSNLGYFFFLFSFFLNVLSTVILRSFCDIHWFDALVLGFWVFVGVLLYLPLYTGLGYQCLLISIC